MAVFTFSLKREILLDKFGPKIKIVSLSSNFIPTLVRTNMQNSIVMLNFSVLDGKYLSWANLVQKVKIVS